MAIEKEKVESLSLMTRNDAVETSDGMVILVGVVVTRWVPAFAHQKIQVGTPDLGDVVSRTISIGVGSVTHEENVGRVRPPNVFRNHARATDPSSPPWVREARASEVTADIRVPCLHFRVIC